MVHQQVLLDYSGNGGGGGPPFHILLNGTVVPRGHSLYPADAYKEYCCPCTSCQECVDLKQPCCDALSNPNGQSIYKIHPHPVWAVHGFPANASDGFVGYVHHNPRLLFVYGSISTVGFDYSDPKMHELNVGGLFKQIWFPCMAKEPIEIITVNIGPETGLGGGTHDTEFYISDFDILVPDTAAPPAVTHPLQLASAGQ